MTPALLGLAAFLALIFGPQLWIWRTLRRHAAERPEMPGTGAELARHLLDEAGLQSVTVEMTETGGDHYSIEDKAVRLSPSIFAGKSITAVAVAAHEAAHAVQDRDGYGPLRWRHALVGKAIVIERIGGVVLLAAPLVFALLRSPIVLALELAMAFAIMA